MSLPVPQVVSTSEIFVSGDVIIHESAVIAPGAILQAAPGSRITIGEGVCLGMGVVLKAYQGEIAIQSGCILGAGVLILGATTVGDHTCIGSTTTIFNTSVEARQMIPAGSLLGDISRSVSLDGSAQEEIPVVEVSEVASPDPETVPKSPVVGQVYINQLLLTLFPHRRHFPDQKK
jgi:carbon dioxide concentrating mechanism protein CcmN